ncbi:MAG: hypothetical protein IT434_16105 [Phycisphaerales bacterium]|nr:hypothetical protein [Phycisphaerales bacterium]
MQDLDGAGERLGRDEASSCCGGAFDGGEVLAHFGRVEIDGESRDIRGVALGDLGESEGRVEKIGGEEGEIDGLRGGADHDRVM